LVRDTTMEIKIQNLLPDPLKEVQYHESCFWSHGNVIFNNQNVYISAKSGRGKSTLLHIIFGLRKDYSGSIFFQDKNIQNFSFDDWSQIRKSKLSIVFQDLRLFDQLNVWENIKLKNELCNTFSESEILKMADHIGIKKQWKQSVGTLSMGQKQRVAILRALCQPFEYLLLDEPFAHLDNNTAQSCLEIIQERCSNENAGILLAGLENNELPDFTQNILIG
jgi:putative ABC transport system ATP-binding protein